MPGQAAVPSPKAAPVTRRSSIRQSLNLASVSKAFADVINKDKDGKDIVKLSKKTKDSRRPSAQAVLSLPRASMGDTRSPSQATIRTATPESKGSTRRRISAVRTGTDEQPTQPDSVNNTPKAGGILTRAASLRTKNANAVGSSLPKYRPRTACAEQQKSSSPVTVRAGTRRRLHSSDESEKEEKQKSVAPSTSSTDKGARPISPLPQRAALKTLNKSPTAITPPSPTKKASTETPTSSRGSPSRPTKTSRTSTSTSAVPRPLSESSGSAASLPPSSSSSGFIPPQTPQTPVVKAGTRRTSQDKNRHAPPTSAAPYPESPSPPTRHVRSRSNVESSAVGNMSHISERAEDDDDEDDVELLLAPIANLGAPTPAMPRIQKSRSRQPPALPPKTPTRGDPQLPTRANMSYLSPLPLGHGDSALLRPPQPRIPSGNNPRNVGRGSILSWEQLASEASKTLGEDDLRMLHDIPAPFRSGAASPALSSTLELPASPCLSALDSPSGYGSISQVLLPDVTPSPAAHRHIPPRSESTSVDSPVTTLLRLQLAQAEHMAKERLMQMQSMEEEIHALKEAHARQMQESARHIAYLEANERNGEKHKAYALSLQDRLRQAEVMREQAVKDAERRSEETVRRSLDSERRKEKAAVRIGCAAKVAASEWAGVRDLAEVELDLVRGDRAVLSVLLAELDQMAQVISF